jgi:hypothetical protein
MRMYSRSSFLVTESMSTLERCGTMMSTHAAVLVDSVGPPSAEVCRAAASFP